MTLRPLATLLAALSIVLAPRTAGAVVLYDGALGGTPSAQGWLYLTEPLVGPSATQSEAGGVTTLDTTPVRTDKAGYFNLAHPEMPVPLDRSAGYLVSFDVRLTDEFHVSDDRAGFSVIVLGEDNAGVEIGFWQDEIWVQNDSPLFTHGEGTPFDTTAAIRRYELCIGDDAFLLNADGIAILTGALRDYSSFGFPYDIANFFFLGDDTSSAAATTELARIALTVGPLPIALDNSLRMHREGDDIVASVAPEPELTEYLLYRDPAASAIGLTLMATSPTPGFRDPDSLAAAETHFFSVRGRDVCGRTYE